MENEETGRVLQPEGREESLSFLQQIFLVFSDPIQAFKALVVNPRWFGTFLVVMLISIVGTQLTYPLVMEMQRDAILQNDQISVEQAEMMTQRFDRPQSLPMRAVTVIFQAIGQLIWLMIMSAILLFGGNILLGGESNFKTIMAISAHSWLVIIPKTILMTPLILLKDSAAVSTSLQVLIPSDRWITPLGAALGAVDLFSIWMVILIVIGISEAYRFTRGKSAAIVVSLYVLMAMVGVGVAALFRGFM